MEKGSASSNEKPTEKGSASSVGPSPQLKEHAMKPLDPVSLPPPKPAAEWTKCPPPVRTLELVRAKFDKVLGINPVAQTFKADCFFEFKIRGGAHDPDLTREGDGPPSTNFPSDTLRPSARWYLNQL